MTVRRIMGIETEYGILVPGKPHVNSMLASSLVVNAYPTKYAKRTTRWDYDEEQPLRDARGYDMSRADADPSQLTDEDLGLANVILTNGARLYVDHAHPEYSSPEVTNPYDAMLWDAAGELVMAKAAELAAVSPGGMPLQLYKNNTDNKGVSYGTHENYLMDRRTPFAQIVTGLTPFLVSRQVYAGAGRVGRRQDGSETGFQLSQRADFFEVEVGLETTIKRPIINTRDEPHADPETYRRLHVIIGDANLSQVATYLKMGTTSLVLFCLEANVIPGDWFPRDPVRALHQVSHDPSLKQVIELRDGRRLTAVELQWEFHDLAAKLVADRWGSDTDAQTLDVLQRWSDILTALAEDPATLASELDWVAKYQLVQRYQQRDGLAWDDDRLQLIDLQYSDIRPEKGLAKKLTKAGKLTALANPDEVANAVAEPPADTRAWFRGKCMELFGESVAAASWDSVIFDLPDRPALQRVPTLDPYRGTQEHVGKMIGTVGNAAELVNLLSKTGN